MRKETITTIEIKKTTRKKINESAKKKETYDDYIKRLMKEVEEK